MLILKYIYFRYIYWRKTYVSYTAYLYLTLNRIHVYVYINRITVSFPTPKRQASQILSAVRFPIVNHWWKPHTADNSINQTSSNKNNIRETQDSKLSLPKKDISTNPTHLAPLQIYYIHVHPPRNHQRRPFCVSTMCVCFTNPQIAHSSFIADIEIDIGLIICVYFMYVCVRVKGWQRANVAN